MTEKNMSRQRQIILLCKTLYFERRSAHSYVPCCGVLCKTNLRESEWSCWRFSSYCARKYVSIIWFFFVSIDWKAKSTRESVSRCNTEPKKLDGDTIRTRQQLPCNFRWLVKTRDHGYIKFIAILFHILSFCFSGFSSPRGSPTRLTWNPGLHQCSERGTRNSRGLGHYCDVCGNWYAASRDRRRHIWRSQVCFSSHYPYLGPWHGALASAAATVAKASRKKWIRGASNYFALIPSRSICQILANFSGVEF